MTPAQRAAYDRLPTTFRQLGDAGLAFVSLDLDGAQVALARIDATGVYTRPGHKATPVGPAQLATQQQLLTAAIAYRDACVRIAHTYTADLTGNTQ